MSLIDDLQARPEIEDIDRRRTMARLTAAAFALAGTGTVITLIRYLRPSIVFEPPTKVGIGRPQDIPVGALLVFPEQRLYVVRTEAGIFAMSSVCTHLGCMTRLDADSRTISCPCHGSKFDDGGHVIGGPAPRPLVRRRIVLEDGMLVVDTREEVGLDDVLVV